MKKRGIVVLLIMMVLLSTPTLAFSFSDIPFISNIINFFSRQQDDVRFAQPPPSESLIPGYSNQQIIPPSGSIFEPGQQYNFSIDWIDLTGTIDTVWLQHDFDGATAITVIPAPVSGSTYTYVRNGLAGGFYFYTWFSNDTLGNVNQTVLNIYSLNKKSATLSLTLNGVSNNITVPLSSIVNIEGNLIEGDGDYIELRQGLIVTSIVINSGTSPVINQTTFSTPVIVEYHAFHPDTQNYTSGPFNPVTYFLNVSSIPEVNPPIYSNVPTNPIVTTFDVNKQHNISIDWVDPEGNLDTVWIEHDFDGATITEVMPLDTGNTYTYVRNGLAASLVPYFYKLFANDTFGNMNQFGNVSSPIIYYVTLKPTIVNLTLDGVNGDIIVPLGSTVSITGTLIEGEGNSLELREGTFALGTLINTGSSPLTSLVTFNIPGSFDYTALSQNTQNYSSSSDVHLVKVSLPINLTKGLNTFSIPLLLDNYAINTVFQDILQNISYIYSYTPSGKWEIYSTDPLVSSTLTNLEYKRGYFIEMKNNSTVSLLGNITNETGDVPQIDLETGWNLIGLHNLSTQSIIAILDPNVVNFNFSEIWEFDNVSSSTQLNVPSDSLNPNKAYWINVESSATTPRYGQPKETSFFDELFRGILDSLFSK